MLEIVAAVKMPMFSHYGNAHTKLSTKFLVENLSGRPYTGAQRIRPRKLKKGTIDERFEEADNICKSAR